MTDGPTDDLDPLDRRKKFAERLVAGKRFVVPANTLGAVTIDVIADGGGLAFVCSRPDGVRVRYGWAEDLRLVMED